MNDLAKTKMQLIDELQVARARIDWSGIETLPSLQTGLRAALGKMGLRITV